MDDYFDGSNDKRLKSLPCRNLRTQMCDGDPDGDGLQYCGDTPTSIYWCLLTMKPLGPDGGPCEPDRCGPDRSCCEPVRRPRLG